MRQMRQSTYALECVVFELWKIKVPDSTRSSIHGFARWCAEKQSESIRHALSLRGVTSVPWLSESRTSRELWLRSQKPTSSLNCCKLVSAISSVVKHTKDKVDQAKVLHERTSWGAAEALVEKSDDGRFLHESMATTSWGVGVQQWKANGEGFDTKAVDASIAMSMKAVDDYKVVCEVLSKETKAFADIHEERWSLWLTVVDKPH